MAHPFHPWRHGLVLSLFVTAGFAAPAGAEVETGRNLEVNHSIEFGLAEGWTAGDDLRLDVLRGSTLIATKTAEVLPDAKVGGIMEVNHVGGDDCWEGVPAGRTPDIKPGDKIVATVLGPGGVDTADVDYFFVRDILFDENPDGSVTGHARGVETAGTFDLAPPVDPDANVMEAKRVGSTVESDFAFTGADIDAAGEFANVAVGGTAGEGELFIDFLDEGGGGSGTTTTFRSSDVPEAPCGPVITTTMSSVSHTVINLANVGQSLVIGGPRLDPTTVDGVTFGGKSYTADNSAADTWSATIPAADLAALGDNAAYELVVTFSDGAPDETRTIRKDVTAPALNASLAPGAYTGGQALALSSDGGEDVRYTRDGSVPRDSSAVYQGTPLALGVGNHTIKAYAVDAAGNRTDATFEYAIAAPATPAGAAPGAVTPIAITPGVPSLAPLRLGRITMQRRISRRALRRRGLRANAVLPAGTEVLRVRVLRVVRGRRVRVTGTLRLVRSAGVYRLVLRSRSVRRLRRGTYVLELVPGRSRAALGQVTRITFRVR